jgi:hypothetical protein
MLHLGMESSSNEVWYDIVTLLEPMERKNKLIPSDKQLLANEAVK